MAEVQYAIASDSEAAMHDIARLERRFETLERQQKRVGQTSRQAAQEGAAGFEQMGASVGKLTLQLIGVGSALQAMRAGVDLAAASYDNLLRKQERARDKNVEIAPALERLGISFTEWPLERTKAEAIRIQRETGVPLGQTMFNLAEAGSSKGPLPPEAAVSMTQATQKLLRFDAETQRILPRVGLAMRQNVPEASPEDVLGFAVAINEASIVNDPAKIAQNVLPTITSMVKIEKEDRDARIRQFKEMPKEQFDRLPPSVRKRIMQDVNTPEDAWYSNTFRDIGVYVSAITQANIDPHGRRSATGTIAQQIQLREFLKDMPELGSHAERMEYMRSDEDARKAFWGEGTFRGRRGVSQRNFLIGPDGREIAVDEGKASFERRFEPIARESMAPGGAVARAEAEGRRLIPPLLDADQRYQQALRDLGADPNLQAARAEQDMQALKERAQFQDVKGAGKSVLLQGLFGKDKLGTGALTEIGVHYIDQLAMRAHLLVRETFGQEQDTALRAVLEANAPELTSEFYPLGSRSRTAEQAQAAQELLKSVRSSPGGFMDRFNQRMSQGGKQFSWGDPFNRYLKAGRSELEAATGALEQDVMRQPAGQGGASQAIAQEMLNELRKITGNTKPKLNVNGNREDNSNPGGF